MRIATWNVNSIRARLDRVLAFLERHDVDVLAFQETKCRDDQFPYLMFSSIGYEVAHFGMSAWNGVAVASRVGLDDIAEGFPGQPQWGDPAVTEARALGATCAGIRVWSVYTPNGRSQDDPHFQYKLDWMTALSEAGAGWLRDDPTAQIMLAGDWNIAPQDDDVWDIDYFRANALTHVSEPERAAFRAFEAAGFQDVVRPHTPGPGVYTYWDYTQLRFPKKEGMRIDFVLASPALAARVTGASIDREERKGKGASDHAPVIVDLAD
jgi:exodeoxyribonuclease-3